MITLVENSNIDRVKWDSCIKKSENAELYALSWFLDCVSPNWCALILSDYEAVMPLPIKTKFVITYIVQPPFCQKLGLFSSIILSPEIISEFEKKILQFKSIRYVANTKLLSKRFKEKIRDNFTLTLKNSYKIIALNYNSNTKRNIKKALENGLTIQKISDTEFLDFYSSCLHYSVPEIYKKVMPKIIKSAIKNNCITIIGAIANQQLQSATAFIYTENKIYYLFTCGNSDSKKNGAMFYVIDYCIREYSNSEFTLDFEGSSIPGIAQFYKGFGAVLEPYYLYTFHKFNIIQKFMK